MIWGAPLQVIRRRPSGVVTCGAGQRVGRRAWELELQEQGAAPSLRGWHGLAAGSWVQGAQRAQPARQPARELPGQRVLMTSSGQEAVFSAAG